MKKKSVEKVIQDRITNALNVGITKEYNTENRRKLWDDSEAKEAAKQKKLNGKKTYEDPVSGKTLHKYNYEDNAVKRKYGEDKWIDHGMETDHIIALKEGHRRYKYNPFLSNEDFNDISNMIKLRAEDKNLSFRVNVSSDVPSKLYGDDVKIRQILMNLLTNAVKYKPSGEVCFRVSLKEKTRG